MAEEKNLLWLIIPAGIGIYLLAKYFPVKPPVEPLPPIPEFPPEYPKEVIRDQYVFLANDIHEEKELRDFLGIDPEGVDIDTYLSKLDLTGLEQWRDYWINIWTGLNRDDLTAFTVLKFEEYYVAPPPPEYPKEVRRNPYAFRVDNVEQEKQVKDFLGIDPPGVDIDLYLSNLNLEGLEQWKNYWINIWAGLGRQDLINFTNDKFNEYEEKIPTPPTPPTPPPPTKEGRSELVDWYLTV